MEIFTLVACLLLPPQAQAVSQEVVPDAQNMTCLSCVISISQALCETDGMIKVRSSLKTRQVEVIVPEGFLTDTSLNVVTKTGYTVTFNRIEQQ